jgi:hypothetical protein
MKIENAPPATAENPNRMRQVATSIPEWAIRLIEKDAIPFEGKPSIPLRKLIVAALEPRRAEGMALLEGRTS